MSMPEKSKSDRKKGAQERFMLIMIAVFFGGVILYTMLPDGPMRDSSVALFTGLVCWLIFKYAV